MFINSDEKADPVLVQYQATEYTQDITQFAQNYVATNSTSPLADGPWQTKVDQVVSDSWTNYSERLVLDALETGDLPSFGEQITTS